MKINLTQQECNNVKIALISTAKQTGVGEAEMGSLLMLAQKFNFVEPKPEAKSNAKPETKPTK